MYLFEFIQKKLEFTNITIYNIDGNILHLDDCIATTDRQACLWLCIDLKVCGVGNMNTNDLNKDIERIKKGEDEVVNIIIEYLKNKEMAKTKIIDYIKHYHSLCRNEEIDEEEIFSFFLKQYDYTILSRASGVNDKVGQFFTEYVEIIERQRREYEDLLSEYKTMLLIYGRIDFILFKMAYEQKKMIEMIYINGATFKEVQAETNFGNAKIYRQLYEGLIYIRDNIGKELIEKI